VRRTSIIPLLEQGWNEESEDLMVTEDMAREQIALVEEAAAIDKLGKVIAIVHARTETHEESDVKVEEIDPNEQRKP
jgi:hypothetical protein